MDGQNNTVRTYEMASLIGIDRHRLTTDGIGVTTLVAFHGCPLRCKFCLNEQCLAPEGIWEYYTTKQLLEAVMVDNMYFLATGGGIPFHQRVLYLNAQNVAHNVGNKSECAPQAFAGGGSFHRKLYRRH